MKGLVILAFLALAGAGNSKVVENPLKVVVVFKGLKKLNGNYQLWFQDKKNKSYYFNPQRSNTAPYVFFSTGAEGSLKENEKLRGSWFLVTYSIMKTGISTEKIISRLETTGSTK